MDQISEHQRDLTNSASMRFVTEFVAAFAYGVYRLSGALDAIEPDVARMREVLEAGKDPVTAEPLYVLLAMAGHPDAHEEARVLARQARSSKKMLAQVITETRTLDAYFQNLTPAQKAILEDPATYQGAASRRTRELCDLWEKQLDGMKW
jgi:adenylosuccinate lyase